MRGEMHGEMPPLPNPVPHRPLLGRVGEGRCVGGGEDESSKMYPPCPRGLPVAAPGPLRPPGMDPADTPPAKGRRGRAVDPLLDLPLLDLWWKSLGL